MNKEDIKIEKAKHKIFLAQDNFDIKLPNSLFFSEYLKIIKKFGYWFLALENGDLQPLTPGQYYFLGREYATSISYYELRKVIKYKLAWGKYKKYKKDWGDLYLILCQCNNEEIETLSKILKLKSVSKENIIPELISNSKNLLEFFDDHPSYNDILYKIKVKLKLDTKTIEISQIEKSIAIKFLEQALSRMTEEQKIKFEKEIIEIVNIEGGLKYKVGTVFTTLTAAQISGFGVYLLASSSLSFITGAIGLTLPFAAYTALSSAISVIIGPVGWIGAGLFTLWKINDVNFSKIIPSVIYISWLREKYSKENSNNFQ
ncbi:YaaW family protein [Flavobacterium dankookense]|uniref:YaaW family protein n=1 Tax=Flavobacterium dankookense TaxID=706186 RepID=UPI00105E60E0|nr:YaaW family protein [Flavobacterium dankookense]